MPASLEGFRRMAWRVPLAPVSALAENGRMASDRVDRASGEFLATYPRERDRLRWRLSRLRRRWQNSLGRLLFGGRRGIDTDGKIPLEALGLAQPDRIFYLATDWFTVRRALNALSVGPDDVFIDFGCGKGRVVMMAARYPFKRVIGVDISEALTSIAERNVELARRLRCKDIALVKADATDYEVPDDVTVAYFYQPFTGATFAKVVDQLLASLDRRPRPLQVIFVGSRAWYESVDAFHERARPIRSWGVEPSLVAIYLLEPGRVTSS